MMMVITPQLNANPTHWLIISIPEGRFNNQKGHELYRVLKRSP
jgi:hypothetical protein